MATFSCDLVTGYVADETTYPCYRIGNDAVVITQHCRYYCNGHFYHGWPTYDIGLGEYSEFGLEDLQPVLNEDQNSEVMGKVIDHPETADLLERIVAGHDYIVNRRSQPIGSLSDNAVEALQRLHEIVAEAVNSLAQKASTWVDNIKWEVTLDDYNCLEYGKILDIHPEVEFLAYADDYIGSPFDYPTVTDMSPDDVEQQLEAAGVPFTSGRFPRGEYNAKWTTVEKAHLAAALAALYDEDYNDDDYEYEDEDYEYEDD